MKVFNDSEPFTQNYTGRAIEVYTFDDVDTIDLWISDYSNGDDSNVKQIEDVDREESDIYARLAAEGGLSEDELDNIESYVDEILSLL